MLLLLLLLFLFLYDSQGQEIGVPKIDIGIREGRRKSVLANLSLVSRNSENRFRSSWCDK
jgi:hypothetical protein